VKFRGAGVNKSPGRAWDDGGEYCDVSVSIAKTGDVVHSLPKKQYRAGFWASAHVYSIAVRSDAAGIECAAYKLPGMAEALRYRRYMLGPKGVQLHAGEWRDHTADFYEADKASPEEIKLMYRRVLLSALQFCLKWGVLPNDDLAWGWQEGCELVDLAYREVFPYPWQLIPAARVTGGLELARYGEGAESRFVILNPRGEEAKGTLTVLGCDVGANLVFAAADGSDTTNVLGDGGVEIELRLPAAGVAVVVPVADAAGVTGRTVTASLRQHPRSGLELSLKAPFLTGGNVVKALLPRGYKCDGPARVQMTPGPEPVKLGYSQVVLADSEDRLLGFFSFTEHGDKPTIVVREKASAEEVRAAEAIQEYFRYYTEEVQKKQRLTLPIIASGYLPEVASVIVMKPASEPRIAVFKTAAQARLVIQAPENGIVDTTRQLLRLLDRKYPFYGILPRFVHRRPKETEIRARAGLAWGTVLRDGTILRPAVSAHLYSHTEKGPAYGKPWSP